MLYAGAEDLTRETVQTVQDLPAVLFEWSIDGGAFVWLTYVSDDGVAIDIAYTFPTDQREVGRELAYYSFFDTLLVLQRRFKEGCGGRHEVRRGAWHGSAWPVRYYPASVPATAATQPARTVPWAAIPAPPGRPAAS